MFKFNKEIRPFCNMLADLIMLANRKDGEWAVGTSRDNPRNDDGVFGRADKTLDKIIELECGRQVRDMTHIEWGSCADPIDDVECAIQHAMCVIEAERQPGE